MTTTNSAHPSRWLWPLALLVVTMLALIMRWYYVKTAMVLQPIRGDATQYYLYAWNLVHHGIFAKDAPGSEIINPDNYRDPGYPLFLAIWMKLLGKQESWYAAVLLCQALLGALTVTLATQLGRHWLPKRWAIAAGLLIAVWPHSISINGYLLSETLFGFLCISGLLLCVHAFRRGSSWWTVAAGITLGAAALTNAILLPFGVLLAGLLAWRKFVPLRLCIALAVSAMILPGVWAVRNTQIAPPVIDSSSLARALQNLEQGSRPNFQDAWRDSVLGDTERQASAHIVLQAVDAEYRLLRSSPTKGIAVLTQRFAQHPIRYASWYLFEKPHLFWDWNIQIGQGDIYVYPTANSPFQTQRAWIALTAICHALNLPLMLLALASLFFAWSKRQIPGTMDIQTGRVALIATLYLAAFATAVYTALQAEPRYSIPFRPVEMLLAMTTLHGMATLWKQSRRFRDQAISPV